MWWQISIASILCAVFYRIGGLSKSRYKWLPKEIVNTKARDFVCPIICGLTMYFVLDVKTEWYFWLSSGLLMFIGLTTYWDKINGEDNFFLHGFACGLAYLPYMDVIPWWVIVIRALVIGVFMYAWCEFFANDNVEETGRGASLVATLPILLLGG